MTSTQKLRLCVASAMVVFGGGTMLAKPAHAADGACSSSEMQYAQGYADGICASRGMTGGRVTSCADHQFTYTCYLAVAPPP
jgi:hypothetical protein